MLRLGLGYSDGRRPRHVPLLPTLGKMPFTQAQKAALDTKAFLIQNAVPWVNPALGANANAPTTGDPFTISPAASGNVNQTAVAYPAPGAGAITVIAYTVPRSKLALIRFLSITHQGGNDPSFTGQVIWRVLRNGGGLRGMHNLTATFGTFDAPKLLTAPILGIENDTISVTVEVPAAFAAMPAGTGTAASFDGFTLSISEATTPQPGTY